MHAAAAHAAAAHAAPMQAGAALEARMRAWLARTPLNVACAAALDDRLIAIVRSGAGSVQLADLSKQERLVVHTRCTSLNLQHESRGARTARRKTMLVTRPPGWALDDSQAPAALPPYVSWRAHLTAAPPLRREKRSHARDLNDGCCTSCGVDLDGDGCTDAEGGGPWCSTCGDRETMESGSKLYGLDEF